jgi:hypothetical protein
MRPGWDQAHNTVAATIGPTPNSSSRSGRQPRMMAIMAFCSSRASFNIVCARRAKVRSATTVVVVSTSHDEWTRRFAAVFSIAASFWPRNLTRMGSGAAMTRLKTCCWASVEALIAERRAAKSTDSAWRSPPLRRVPTRGRAIASRAARIASSGSDFAPLRRPRDLQDLHVLATLAQTTWTVIVQGAQGLRDRELLEIALHSSAETSRQLTWLNTRMKVAAPKPSSSRREGATGFRLGRGITPHASILSRSRTTH